MTAAKRAMSILLSGAMLMGNLFSPITAFAGEAVTEGNEGYEAPVKEEQQEQSVTEAPDYIVTLPYYEEAAFMVDEGHVKKRDGQGDIVLAYKAGDDVKITVSERDGFELEEIRILDEKNNAQGYTWEQEDTFAFLMPEKDLKVAASFKEPVQETEMAAADPADTYEPEAQETAAEEGALEATEDAPKAENMVAEETADKPADNAATAAETVLTETAGNPAGNTAMEAPAATEPAKNAETAEGKALQIPAVDPETEADGFPVGGSIVRLGEVTLSDQVTGYAADEAFEDIPYPHGTCSYDLKSSTVQFGTPGLYEMIYRADESTTGRFWYVVRPVRIVEGLFEAEVSSEDQEDHAGDEDVSSDEDDPTHLSQEDITEEAVPEETTEAKTAEGILTENTEKTTEKAEGAPEAETEQVDPMETPVDDRQHNILFGTGEGYTISLENDQVTYQEGDEVSFTVTAKEKYTIRTASAFIALSGEETDINTSEADEAPVLVTPEEVEVSRTDSLP